MCGELGGPIVEGCLGPGHAGELALSGARKAGFQEGPANALVLGVRMNGNRADSGDRRAFVKAIAPDNLSFRLGNHAAESGMGKHHGQNACCDLD